MKKIVALTLVAIMCISPLASTANAMEPFLKDKQVTEGRKSSRSRDYRRDYRRDDHKRRRHHNSGSSIGAAIVGGLIVGGIIGSATRSSSSSCATVPTQPILYCDTNGNCWYQ